MARNRIVITLPHETTDLQSGEIIVVPGSQSIVPYTPAEEAQADLDKAAETAALAPILAEQQRIAAIKANTRRQALVSAIQNSDDAQLVAYINSQVTDLASAKTVLVNLALLIAGVIRS